MPVVPKAKRLQSRRDLGLQEVAELAHNVGSLSGRYLLPIQGGNGCLRQRMEWEGVGSESWTCLMPLSSLHSLPLFSPQ